MKRIATVFAVSSVLSLSAPSAGALSCAPPEPIDWSTRLPAAGGAVIGIVESVEVINRIDYQSDLLLQVRVTEYLHGRAPATIEYTTPNFDSWGPYYEVGQEIAIVIENGQVRDGQMNLCGPWFSPEELRQAADDYGSPIDVEPTPFDELLRFLERLLRLLFGWYS